MFEKVTNILGDKTLKEDLVYCFFSYVEYQLKDKIYFHQYLPSIQNYENIADKLKIRNLFFMIFIVQINKLPRIILGGCRIFLQQSEVSSIHLTRSLNFQIDS